MPTRHEKMVNAAVWLAEQGNFYIGWGSQTDGKAVNRRWKSDMTSDPNAVRAMLHGARNPLVIPVERGVLIDVDKYGWYEKLLGAGLPPTFTVFSPTVRPAPDGGTFRGRHVYALAPAGYDVTTIPGVWAGGEVRRSVGGEQSMALAPWALRSDGVYEPDPGSPRELAVLPESVLHLIKSSPKPGVLGGGGNGLITIHRGDNDDWLWPEEGGRHDTLRDRIRVWRGQGTVGEPLRALAWGYIERHALNREGWREITREEVERMCKGAEEKFDDDPPKLALVPSVDPTTIPISNLFVKQPDYHAANASKPTYVSPLVAYGTVSLVSGPPKGGKSTLISNLLAARQYNIVFLWGEPVPYGPMALVTEEGGYPVVRKTLHLPDLDILDRLAFVSNGLRSLDDLLAVLSGWVASLPEGEPPLVIIDTLAVWGDIKDENDAIAATKAIVALRVWAQSTGAAVVLVHHTRKGGGEHGEAIRGSGGIFAAVDQSIELNFTNDEQSDDRTLVIVGRLTFGETKALAFNRTTMLYDVTTRVAVEKYPTDQFPVDGSGGTGWTNVEAGQVWGMAPTSANKHLKALCDNGVLVARQEQAPGSRAKHLAYWRARPLLVLDNRSVASQMADIFKPETES